jgi:transglutaminase-like putative cysteine protease
MLAFAAPQAFAEEGNGEAAPPHTETVREHVMYKIGDNGAVTTTDEVAVKILTKEGIDEVKQPSLSYSASAEKFTITSAYTLKADGRRIDVSKDSYQYNTNSGAKKGKPAYSDYNSIDFIFPDLEVGDTVVLATRDIQTQPIFPGLFSLVNRYSKSDLTRDVRVTLDYPATMDVHYENPGMTMAGESESDGRKVVRWTFENTHPAPPDIRRALVYDPNLDPGLIVSNIPSYQVIAEAYGRRADPKAVPNERVRTLAASLVKDGQTDKEKAKALYEWVSKTIGYAGNCIGIGAVVPRDLDFVLDNHLGDCKDHATLLQAMLAAENIPSTQALINAGDIYHLGKVPSVSDVNHVIDYIPGLDLYVDATSSQPFGLLPVQEVGKPVLLVDGYKDGTTTPILRDGYDQTIKIDETIRPDGSMEGTVTSSSTGYLAASISEGMDRLPKESEGRIFRQMFRKVGLNGTASYVRGELKTDPFSYEYSAKFSVDQAIRLNAPGAIQLTPYMMQSMVAEAIRFAVGAPIESEYICHGKHYEDDYTVRFPDDVHVLAIPDGVSLSSGPQTYKSTYAMTDNVLTVTRRLDDTTPGPTCTPETFKAIARLANDAKWDVGAQIVYK